MVWPNVIEEENGVKRAYDIPSRLLMDRIVMLTEEINSATANSIVGQLLFLEKENNKKAITMYINSPGGSVTDGFAIYDVIHQIKCPVNTICIGMAASMAAFLLASLLMIILAIFVTPYFILPLIAYFVLVSIFGIISTKSVIIALKAIPSSAIQLWGYGAGFINAYTRKIIFRQGRNIQEEILLRKGK